MPDQQSDRAANGRQDQVLDEQLPQQPHAAGADGEPDAHLAAAGQRAREHHRGDVGAGDDQQQRDRGAERGDDGVEFAR